MRWLKFFTRRRNKPVAPVSPRTRPLAPVPREVRRVKKVDPIFEDTGSLELFEEEEEAKEFVDPYATSSWEKDPQVGVRRVDDLGAINRKPAGGDKTNPYDTGVFKKGW